jgi:hypothetical protein
MSQANLKNMPQNLWGAVTETAAHEQDLYEHMVRLSQNFKTLLGFPSMICRDMVKQCCC